MKWMQKVVRFYSNSARTFNVRIETYEYYVHWV